MISSFFFLMDKFPLLSSGKIDQHRLLEMYSIEELMNKNISSMKLTLYPQMFTGVDIKKAVAKI
jgi:hypothetical protein